MTFRQKLGWGVIACLFLFGLTGATHAQLLAPGDPILAIDFDASNQSAYPFLEEPFQALDADPGTKYLNFGKENSGFIVTPSVGATTVQSMYFTSANDAEARDPLTWELYGTNDPIISADNSDGMAESWTFIANGDTMLPTARQTDGPVLSFANATSYSSYRMTFPTLRDSAGANSMQVADVLMFESVNASGFSIFNLFDPSLAIDVDGDVPESAYPAIESPPNALDGDPMTKYLNFGRENSGFIVTPSAGPSIVESFQITTANDFPDRDPSSWELYGTNSPINSTDNSVGDGEPWTLIDTGSISLPGDRLTAGDAVMVNNTTEYASYRMVFPTVRNPDGDMVDSTQFSEIQFFGQTSAVVDGDFNNDQVWDCLDIDALSAAIAEGSADLSFDMNGDGVITLDDITEAGVGWLAVGGANNPGATGGNAFLVGDANLDGVVDGQDFILWNGNKFSVQSDWCGGNFNGDGVIDGQDFIAWNSNKFMSSDHAAVPEPRTTCLCLVALAMLLYRVRK